MAGLRCQESKITGVLLMGNLKFRAWDGERMGQVAVLNMGGLVSFVGSGGDFFIAESVMQHTGLKDNFGTEIYEGDIVEYRWDESDEQPDRLAVEWLHGAFVVDRLDLYGELTNCSVPIRVIGNRYENPELLDDPQNLVGAS
jgi:hypothetical protein